MAGFGEIAERLRRSTVQVLPPGGRGGGGSGIVWNSAGLILTNAHVARGPQAEVELWDGRRFAATVTSRDPRRDLAALRIEGAAGLVPIEPGDSGAVRPGEMVIAIGNPLGFAGALSTGVVHSIGALPGMGRQSWIRATARLAPGNSGGPLANARGQAIGINTAIVNGLGVAAPANAAAEFLRRGARPTLGVVLEPVRLGLRIREIDPEGAAAAAALRAGDVLLSSFDDLCDALDSARDVIRLRFLRGDTDRESAANRLRVREVYVGLRAQRPLGQGPRAEAA
jgi:serine protease Do